MLKTYRKTLIITSIVIVLPILAGLLYWNRLPDMMATHFGADNEANGYSSKLFAVFGLPLFCLAMHWIAAVVTLHDPRKQNISPKLFTLVLWIVPVVSLICGGIMYPYNLGYKLDISFIMQLMIALMFIIIGNYLPKARQNYTIGIKLPWTLENEENWNLTHRLAGFLWVIGGALLLILTLLKGGSLTGLLAITIVISVLPCIYSFWLHVRRNL